MEAEISSEQETETRKTKHIFSGSKGNFVLLSNSKKGLMTEGTTEISLLFTKIVKTR